MSTNALNVNECARYSTLGVIMGAMHQQLNFIMSHQKEEFVTTCTTPWVRSHDRKKELWQYNVMSSCQQHYVLCMSILPCVRLHLCLNLASNKVAMQVKCATLSSFCSVHWSDIASVVHLFCFQLNGSGTTSFSDCIFNAWDHQHKVYYKIGNYRP